MCTICVSQICLSGVFDTLYYQIVRKGFSSPHLRHILVCTIPSYYYHYSIPFSLLSLLARDLVVTVSLRLLQLLQESIVSSSFDLWGFEVCFVFLYSSRLRQPHNFMPHVIHLVCYPLQAICASSVSRRLLPKLKPGGAAHTGPPPIPY